MFPVDSRDGDGTFSVNSESGGGMFLVNSESGGGAFPVGSGDGVISKYCFLKLFAVSASIY
jgi:hypothetical protein